MIVRHSPYGQSLARAAIDTALAAAAFEQAVNVLFQGAGVLNLLPQQDGRTLGLRDQGRVIDSMPLYDIETLYVDAPALARYGIEPGSLPRQARLLEAGDLREQLLAHDHLLSF